MCWPNVLKEIHIKEIMWNCRINTFISRHISHIVSFELKVNIQKHIYIFMSLFFLDASVVWLSVDADGHFVPYSVRGGRRASVLQSSNIAAVSQKTEGREIATLPSHFQFGSHSLFCMWFNTSSRIWTALQGTRFTVIRNCILTGRFIALDSLGLFGDCTGRTSPVALSLHGTVLVILKDHLQWSYRLWFLLQVVESEFAMTIWVNFKVRFFVEFME